MFLPSVLQPEQLAWRSLMHLRCKASDVKHNDPLESPLLHCDVDAEIQSYTEDIALLRKLIQHKLNLTAAVRRRPFPSEVWHRIFLECREADPWAPTTISHVCRRWRQVSFDYYVMWSRIELGRRERALDRASVWAERAGTSNIDLAIQYTENEDRAATILWLQERADRIKSLNILHMDRTADSRLLPSLPPLVQLEALQVRGLEGFNLDMRMIARVLESSPGLTSLSLAGVDKFSCPESLRGLATSITHLSFGELSHIDYKSPRPLDAILPVIAACTGLQSLECHTLSLPDKVDPVSPTISLPSLSSLSIGDGPETCIILKYLHAPQLHTLRLVRGPILDETEKEVERPFIDNSWDGYIELFVDCLRSLHEACSPRITTVIWDHTVVDVCLMDRFTLYLREMEELQCHGLLKTGEVSPCKFLYIGIDGEACPYPRLRSMTFAKCTLGRLRLDSIAAAINGRGPPFSRRITRLVVENCQGVSNLYLSRV